MRPRWPSGEISALGPEGSRFETRFHRRSTVYGACCTLNHNVVAKCPPVGVVWKFGEGVCQLRCHPYHMTVVQNYEVRPKIALVLLQKWDFNKTKLNKQSDEKYFDSYPFHFAFFCAP
ncbi:hypothetical protein AVEN_153978-1 [Araneus ventricosus]|uniref:Uncharacterized protein n=1 Tax=Araneus ventricosus TaxID=182803 RepID=A0A4Y2JJP3_ARAVE|nr:hypothetical protein AVEN_153978-1 [Araneus ventricosus]